MTIRCTFCLNQDLQDFQDFQDKIKTLSCWFGFNPVNSLIRKLQGLYIIKDLFRGFINILEIVMGFNPFL
ncbi:hypothetical protein BGP_1462 [Beggiatoa sp. PS]|nr:hypothetical protein BGP_1462 [Beggiatoa sp. PS]